jgi:hypothetical protein
MRYYHGVYEAPCCADTSDYAKSSLSIDSKYRPEKGKMKESWYTRAKGFFKERDRLEKKQYQKFFSSSPRSRPGRVFRRIITPFNSASK